MSLLFEALSKPASFPTVDATPSTDPTSILDEGDGL
jgi:hypothetical protein